MLEHRLCNQSTPPPNPPTLSLSKSLLHLDVCGPPLSGWPALRVVFVWSMALVYSPRKEALSWIGPHTLTSICPGLDLAESAKSNKTRWPVWNPNSDKSCSSCSPVLCTLSALVRRECCPCVVRHFSRLFACTRARHATMLSVWYVLISCSWVSLCGTVRHELIGASSYDLHTQNSPLLSEGWATARKTCCDMFACWRQEGREVVGWEKRVFGT